MKIKFNGIKQIAHKKICPLCGLENKRLYGNCSYCNADLSGRFNSRFNSIGRKARGGLKRPMFLFSLLFIIIIILAVYAVFRHWRVI